MLKITSSLLRKVNTKWSVKNFMDLSFWLQNYIISQEEIRNYCMKLYYEIKSINHVIKYI